MSGFIYRLPETFCTFANNRLLGSYWLFNNRNWFTPFGESVPISPPADINSYACSSRRRIRLREHGNVAAFHFYHGRSHAFRDPPLEIGMNGMVLQAQNVPTWL